MLVAIVICTALSLLPMLVMVDAWVGRVISGICEFVSMCVSARDMKQQRNELKTDVCDVSQ